MSPELMLMVRMKRHKKIRSLAMLIGIRTQEAPFCRFVGFYQQPAQQQPGKNGRDSTENHTGRVNLMRIGKGIKYLAFE
jgi:hypothetical protein